MDKNTRIYPIVAAGLAILFIAGGNVLAGGSGEELPETSSSGMETTTAAPVTNAESLDDAIMAAMEMPSEWDYDPDSRFIYEEGADITFPLALDDSVWLNRLEPLEYHVLREKGTEYAFSNPMHANKERGIYYSRATGQPLFSSEDKYDSGTGWPSFTKPINANAIVYLNDTKLFSPRIEVVDSLSGSHLGHVFPDGPAPTGQRYCINAASLVFVPEGEEPPAFIQELHALAAAGE